MRRLVEADLKPEGLEEWPEDVVRSGRDQALPDGKFVEKIEALASGFELLRFQTLLLIEFVDLLSLQFGQALPDTPDEDALGIVVRLGRCH